MSSTGPLTDEQKKEAVELYEAYGSHEAAGKSIGISRTAFQHRLYKALEDEKTKAIEVPEDVLDEEDEPTQEILDRMRRGYERKAKAAAAREWYRIRVKDDKPYAILWFGDPHLGPHCTWPILDRHIEIARQPGVYGGNIGDTTDSWPWTGRMAKLWAESDISHKSERKLATWFMFDAGIKWMLWLLGNHDHWQNAEFYKQLGAKNIPVQDWRAKFTLVHNNGSETRIDAAHGRKGSSIYNPTHGTLREAKFGEDAHLFITGHTHTFGLFEYEMPERKTHTWLAQVRGYKTFDHYALVKGFPEGQKGHAIMSVIHPGTGQVQCYSDPEEGNDYLQWKRAKA